MSRLTRCAALAALLAFAGCATPPTPGPIRPAQSAIAPQLIWPDAPLQCVPFARGASGIDLYGDAHTWWAQAQGKYPRADRPQPGAVIVLRGWRNPQRGHVAVVRRILSEREILVDHANWANQGEIALSAPVRDVSPAGDWSAVSVWNVLGGAWGGRVYGVEGFILPN